MRGLAAMRAINRVWATPTWPAPSALFHTVNGPAQLGGLHPTIRFGPGQLQPVLQPGLGREEPLVTERSRSIDMVGDRDRCGVGLTA
jgi:hypothetical protein